MEITPTSRRADLEGPASELDKVVRWRLKNLLDAGYSGEPAQRLAEKIEVDLHAAVAMVESGCPPPVAAEILL